MTASRNRRLLIIGVLAALFALGGGGLAYLATASSGGSASGSNAADTGPPSTAGPSDGSSPGTTGAPGAGSPGAGDDDTAPPKPRKNVPTTGIDLDGNGDVDCFTVLPFAGQVQVPLRVTGVGVASTKGAIVVDRGGCSNCPGTRLGAGGADSCQVGVRLSGTKPYPDPISVTVTLTMSATCTDASRKPCGVATGDAPSPANPIAIKVTGTFVGNVFPPDDPNPESSPDEGQATPDPGETPSSPGTESVPEVETS